MHVSNEAQVLLVPTGLAYRPSPFLNRFENLGLHPCRPDGWSLGKPPDKLVEELLGADLQVERVAAVLDANIEQVDGQQRNVWIAVIDVIDNGRGGLARCAALLGVDEVGDLEVEGQVGLVVLGTAGRLDEALELRRRPTKLAPAIAGSSAC